MADCPQCGKKVPDNMKFCGFCGIEVETGKAAATDRWIGFLQTQIEAIVRANSTKTNAQVAAASVTIGGAALATSLASGSSLLIGMVVIFALIGGPTMLFVLDAEKEILAIFRTMCNKAYLLALKGELSTSSEFGVFIGQQRADMERDAKGRFLVSARLVTLLSDYFETGLIEVVKKEPPGL